MDPESLLSNPASNLESNPASLIERMERFLSNTTSTNQQLRNQNNSLINNQLNNQLREENTTLRNQRDKYYKEYIDLKGNFSCLFILFAIGIIITCAYFLQQDFFDSCYDNSHKVKGLPKCYFESNNTVVDSFKTKVNHSSQIVALVASIIILIVFTWNLCLLSLFRRVGP
jgi:hypothetical protein